MARITEKFARGRFTFHESQAAMFRMRGQTQLTAWAEGEAKYWLAKFMELSGPVVLEAEHDSSDTRVGQNVD